MEMEHCNSRQAFLEFLRRVEQLKGVSATWPTTVLEYIFCGGANLSGQHGYGGKQNMTTYHYAAVFTGVQHQWPRARFFD
jgi:hypothetical protein